MTDLLVEARMPSEDDMHEATELGTDLGKWWNWYLLQRGKALTTLQQKTPLVQIILSMKRQANLEGIKPAVLKISEDEWKNLLAEVVIWAGEETSNKVRDLKRFYGLKVLVGGDVVSVEG
jgi:hypothetical protein